MGNCLGGILRRRNRRHIVLILIGLDNAGKTKTVNNLSGDKDETVLPTVGFKAVNLVHKDTPVTIYDLGGGPNFRQIWTQYYSEVHGVIFVIDSSDFSRLDECRIVLEEVLSHDKISGKPVLVLANKQDKHGALDDIDVVEKLNIEPLVNKYRCPTLVESYSATIEQMKSKKIKLDPGLKKGYHWLLNYIVRRYGDLNLRVQTDMHADLERRKRLMNKASDRASQTFTAVSDDIATQTGFSNPNYKTLKSTSTNEISDNLILVQPIRVSPKSLDTTVTIESGNSSVGKPKLSPLFGKSSGSSTVVESGVELEPRSEFRKLSPIVRNKVPNQHIDFLKRPQSSPTLNKKLEMDDSSGSVTPKASHVTEVVVTDGWASRSTALGEVEVGNGNRDLAMGERLSDLKPSCSEVCASSSVTLPPRPASASRAIRRQLEAAGAHRRRLSLRYMHRNRTSPERFGLFHYEPAKTQQKLQLEKGDFEQVNYLAQQNNLRDVTL